MATKSLVRRNFYRDSVALMRLAADLEGLDGIARASALMATRANLDMLARNGTRLDDIEAGANDLLIVIEGAGDDALAAALDHAAARFEAEIRPVALPGEEDKTRRPKSLAEASAQAASARLALISCPGAYAAAEATKALRLGLDVMIFSDNVPLDDEVELKTRAERAGRLVMGPDCGTAIINGVPLGFANIVRRGPVGLVAASGTGLQQVTCLLDRRGVGVSQALGTGGRDLSAAVGAITMLRAIAMLAGDAGTETIVLISKPPEPAVMRRVLEAAAGTGKPVVASFIGAAPPTDIPGNVAFAATLEDAAALAAGAAPSAAIAVGGVPGPAAGRDRLVGLFSGGTFCYEAQAIAAPTLGRVLSNTPLDARDFHGDDARDAHYMLDLGEDAYTSGRPHPMIDFGVRLDHIERAASDPKTGVIVLDVVLGTGAHEDPASVLAPAIARAAGPVFVGSVCGTEADGQMLSRQEAALREAGMVVAASNAEAARTAVHMIRGPGS